ncbi:MAG: DUF3467 domain-containing protein [Actinomycetota bacterium]
MDEINEPPTINIDLARPEDRAGVWANFANVSHSIYEFTLDFARLEFDADGPTGGVLVSRISMSPLFIQQLIEALENNYEKWAAKAMPPEVTDGLKIDQTDAEAPGSDSDTEGGES